MALPASLEDQLALALAAEARKVEADERAAGDIPSWWTGIIGASSSRAGALSSAAAGRRLYELHRERAARVRATGDVAGFEALYRDIQSQVSIPSAVIEAGQLLTVSGAAREVGAGIAADTGALAGGLLKASPFILAGLGVLAVVIFLPRLRRG